MKIDGFRETYFTEKMGKADSPDSEKSFDRPSAFFLVIRMA